MKIMKHKDVLYTHTHTHTTLTEIREGTIKCLFKKSFKRGGVVE